MKQNLQVKSLYRVAKSNRMPYVAGHPHKRATNYRAFLQKMTDEDKASYDSTPPCTSCTKLHSIHGWSPAGGFCCSACSLLVCCSVLPCVAVRCRSGEMCWKTLCLEKGPTKRDLEKRSAGLFEWVIFDAQLFWICTHIQARHTLNVDIYAVQWCSGLKNRLIFAKFLALKNTSRRV